VVETSITTKIRDRLSRIFIKNYYQARLRDQSFIFGKFSARGYRDLTPNWFAVTARALAPVFWLASSCSVALQMVLATLT
jgi:hypothetical protein